jgi:hypothetical protein
MIHQHSITPKECACPLLGWNTNCHKWPNVACLIRKILRIHGSQIELKKFSMLLVFSQTCEDIDLE